jgi:hypothetical protein
MATVGKRDSSTIEYPDPDLDFCCLGEQRLAGESALLKHAAEISTGIEQPSFFVDCGPARRLDLCRSNLLCLKYE